VKKMWENRRPQGGGVDSHCRG